VPLAPLIGHRRDDPARNADEHQQHQDIQALRLAHGHPEARGGHMRHIRPDEGTGDGGKAAHHSIQAIELAHAIRWCQAQHQRTIRAPDAAQRNACHDRHDEQHADRQAEQSGRRGQQEGGHPQPQHPVQRATRTDAIHPATPHESAHHGESDGRGHDIHDQPLRGSFVAARGHRDVHHVQPHECDHGVDGIGVEDASEQETQQPRVLPAVAQCRQRLRRGLADHLQRKHRPRVRVATLTHEHEAGYREQQEPDGHQREAHQHV